MSKIVARGSFEVKMTPASASDALIGRFTLDKSYSGDLEATGTGEMLAVQDGVAGSAGYVALERITGRLEGRRGSFTLQHFGLMDRGKPRLEVLIVPDSGTDGLTGLSGTLTIEAGADGHTYVIEGHLPD